VSEQAGVPFKGAPSVDVLLDQFVAGVAAKDADTLHTLRVNEAEYRRIIVPGSAPVGKTPVYVADLSNEFFWKMLDQKSRDFLDVVLNDWRIPPGAATTPTENPHGTWYRIRQCVSVNDGMDRGTLRSGWIWSTVNTVIGFN
jgi:hypothetical protein